MASKLLRSAPGDTAPGREWGGVWMPLVCSGGLRSVLPSAPSVWHREAAFCSQLRSMEPKRRSFCSGSDPRLGARASPTFSSHPSVAPGVPGDMSCTGLSKEAPPGAAAPGDKLPPLSTGELSPLAGERLPSREPEGVWRWALGLRVPQRPLTHGASSVVLTGDWERYSRVSGTRAGGVALMGEGREFRLGLSGALPLGAWLKTTTHCPTCKRGEGMGYGLLGGCWHCWQGAGMKRKRVWGILGRKVYRRVRETRDPTASVPKPDSPCRQDGTTAQGLRGPHSLP